MDFYRFAFEAYLEGMLGMREESKEELQLALFLCEEKLQWLETLRPLWLDHHVLINDVLLDLKNYLIQLIDVRL